MRYLTQSSHHSWTFRFQFPRRVRDYFYGQFEYKYSLGKVTPNEAQSFRSSLSTLIGEKQKR